jgi:hypothetical protein
MAPRLTFHVRCRRGVPRRDHSTPASQCADPADGSPHVGVIPSPLVTRVGPPRSVACRSSEPLHRVPDRLIVIRLSVEDPAIEIRQEAPGMVVLQPVPPSVGPCHANQDIILQSERSPPPPGSLDSGGELSRYRSAHHELGDGITKLVELRLSSGGPHAAQSGAWERRSNCRFNRRRTRESGRRGRLHGQTFLVRRF